MKKIGFIVVAAAMAAVFTACGMKYDEPDESVKGRLMIHSDGKVDAHICGEFSQDYYNEDELADMVSEELVAYNGTITLLSHKQEGNEVSLDLAFDDCSLYEDYMTLKLFCGTVQEAYDRGYDFNRALKRANGSDEVIGKAQLTNMADRHMLIFEGARTCICPGNINYYSQELKLINANTVQSVSDGVYYIIY